MQKAYFNNIQQTLIQAISNAQKEVCIAVAWFVNRYIFDALISATKSNIRVQLIIVNDLVNNRPGGLKFQDLIYNGAEFYFANNNRLMHNKFCIIDGSQIFTGSYNFTYAAEKNNFENLIEIRDEATARSYTKQFHLLKNSASHVTDIEDYLRRNPPLNDALSVGEVIRDEFYYEEELINTSTTIEDKLARLQIATEYFPINVEFQDKKNILYTTYSKNLSEFCKRYPKILTFHIGKYYPWTSELLEQYINTVHWSHLQENTSIDWTADLISKFRSILFHNNYSRPSHFVYNKSIYISINEMKDLHYWIYDEYQKNKSWYPQYDDSSIDPDLPFYINRVFDEFKNPEEQMRRNGKSELQISYQNNEVSWKSEDLLENIDNLDFWFTTPSSKIHWSKELLLAIKEKRTHQFYIFCQKIYLTTDEISQFNEILDWQGIAGNTRIDWSIQLFESYQSQLMPYSSEFSANQAFPWTIDFINDHSEWLDFQKLSGNRSVPFTESLIYNHIDRWKWRYTRANPHWSLSENEAIKWTYDSMEKFKDKLEWTQVAENYSADWTLTLMERFMPESESERYTYITNLSYNTTVWERVIKPNINDDFLRAMAPDLPNDSNYIFVIR